jgi:small conductance mechanosensitive channel
MHPEKIEVYYTQGINWAVHFLPSLISALLFLIIGWWLIGRTEKLISSAMRRRNVDSSLQSFLRTLFSFGAKILLIVMVAGQVGFQTTSLAAILGAAGLAIGLALQGSLANLAGGVLILMFKPFKVGDIITAATFTGKVQEIQIFNTILLLPDNKVAIIPNGGLSNGAIVNNNMQPWLKLDLFVTVSADKDLAQIKEKIKEFLHKDPKALNTPEINIAIQEIAGKSLKLVISLYCKPEDLQEVQYKANENLVLFYRHFDFSL